MKKERPERRITSFTLTPGDIEKLARLAEQRTDGNRSQTIRALIRQAAEPVPELEPEKK